MTTAKPAAPRGLGRGLSALLGDAPPAQEAQGQRGNGARLIAIDLLGPNPFQPRRQFDETDLRELTESVRANGILQPIVVRPDPRGQGRFQIVAGERRWRSAQRAGLHEVPVVVRDFTDDQSLEVAIVENVQRAGLNSIEEALGYQALIDRFGYTQDKLAENVGKSRSHIANTLRLLQLPAEVRRLVEEGKLTAGHARALITAKDPVALAREAVARGLSVREMEALATSLRTTPAKGGRKAAHAPKDVDTLRLEKDLSAATGCRVTIEPDGANKDSGRVVIVYRDADALDEVLRRLG
ncbi:MAG: ParB/RepB/Spo0J family partition protein [Alphaproteobacteria bacterium]|nr:ParB/RepB/Spo0J family partition protein [Alphaproteobacteria bacterium]